MERFDLPGFANNIARYPITQLYTIPSVILFLTRTPLPTEVTERLAGLTNIVCSAAPLGKKLQIEFMEKLRATTTDGMLKPKVMQIWGMTELTTVVRNKCAY